MPQKNWVTNVDMAGAISEVEIDAVDYLIYTLSLFAISFSSEI